MIDLLKDNSIIQQQLEENLMAMKLNNIELDKLSKYDVLTGILNRRGFLNMAEQLITELRKKSEDGVFIFIDMNNLKIINDRDGHNAGDQYLKDACRIVCKTFAHSPVFRVGGDEFAVIAQGDDYTAIDALVARVKEQNEEALRSGGIIIACGMAKREGDTNVASVFERADQQMYNNKADLKNRRKG